MVADFSKKQKSEISGSEIAFQIAGVLFLIIIVALVLADFNMYRKKQELALQVNNYKKQIEDIKNSSQNLKEEIANSDNQDYLEKIAYEQLGEQKPGEKEVIFIAPQAKPAAAQNPENFWSAKSWSAWFSGAWQWIKSRF